MFDRTFMANLDTKPHLLAFDNGVWDLDVRVFRASRPDDMLSKTVGYDYTDEDDSAIATTVRMYWEELHPDTTQREYMVRMFARQLYGDNCNELLHLHAGPKASNGKSRFFEMLNAALGDYVCKFAVEYLVTKARQDPGKPNPEYARWRGSRILYCTEATEDDTLHSGILKDMTGGEEIVYRLLFSNTVLKYRPMHKLHMMCNEKPTVNGNDKGIMRRIRVLEYQSQFVPPTEADPEQHRYPSDPSKMTAMIGDVRMRMAFLRNLLHTFEKKFDFTMPEIVTRNSSKYLGDNNPFSDLIEFIKDRVRKQDGGYFQLKTIKQEFETHRILHKLKAIKTQAIKGQVEEILGVQFKEQHYISTTKQNITNVIVGWQLCDECFVGEPPLAWGLKAS